MSVSDPSIKDIKGFILKFLKESQHISDTHVTLQAFCECIERIFNSGLLQQHNRLGFVKRFDPWIWMLKASTIKDPIINYNFSNSADNVKRSRSVSSNSGRFRLLIRFCLMNRCLHVPVEYLIKRQKNGSLYKDLSVLGDEILSEIFLSVLLQCGKLNFQFDLGNASFLDQTWSLPTLLKLELVPSSTLGISVSFADDKAIIMQIASNGVIAENTKVQIGDVLDNLNGIHICSNTKGRLNSIIKSSQGLPITLWVIKFKSTTGEPFPPIIHLMKQLQLDPALCSNPDKQKIRSSSPGFKVMYLGNVSVGNSGDSKLIDKSVRMLLSQNFCKYDDSIRCEKVKKTVFFEIGELGVKVIDNENPEVLFKHFYMEISSCGSAACLPNYFAYIAGDEYCNLAKKFTCYAFYSKSVEAACTILQSMGQGFHRTHFAV